MDEGYFVQGLGDVRLDVQWRSVGCGEFAETVEGGVAAAWCESGRDDWVDECSVGIDGVDVVDCGLCCVETLFGGLVNVVGWADIFVVHADAADEGALAVGMAECGEGVGGWDVDGCKVGCAGCAVGERASNDLVVDAQSFWRCLFGIGLLVLRV